MPHRDPQTGQFVADMDSEPDEQVSIQGELIVPAADVGGQTAPGWGQQGLFEGLLLFDFDDILDRDEVGVVRHADHEVRCTIPATQTADGTAKAQVEVSASPARDLANSATSGSDIDDTAGDFDVQVGRNQNSDSVDLIGPTMSAWGHGSFSSSADSLGGGGMTDRAEWSGMPVNPEFHPRDELFLNGAVEQNNIADASIHVGYDLQYHVDVLHQSDR